MREILFVTGGGRSGKSGYAQRRVEAWGRRLLYIATAEVRDAEMADRVALHRHQRGAAWETLEAPLDLPAALGRARGYDGALLDCLTLWTANLLEAHGTERAALDGALAALLEALAEYPGRLCLVTNEVGGGIVPANALARSFRDLAGHVNQRVAALATEAVLVVAGLPLRLR